jgi:flagellar basal body-associated protein FliL
MSKTCNNCGNSPATMPIISHELEMDRAERKEKRLLWVIVFLIALIALLVGTILGLLAYESQFETVEESHIVDESVVVDADENGVANYIGNNGDINNGEDNS